MQEFGPNGSGIEGVIGGETNEWVGATEICSFEGCSLIGNEELAGYLSEVIPPSHLEGCPRIEFDPNNAMFIEDPQTLGFFECNSHAIHIASENRFPNGVEGVIETVTHEVGHNAHASLMQDSAELATKWEQLHLASLERFGLDGLGFVSAYAMTNQYEEFAESYMNYIRDPETLLFVSPEKCQFMRDYVFLGREYEPAVLAY